MHAIDLRPRMTTIGKGRIAGTPFASNEHATQEPHQRAG